MQTAAQKEYLSEFKELIDKVPQHEILKATENSVISFINELIKHALKEERDSKSWFFIHNF